MKLRIYENHICELGVEELIIHTHYTLFPYTSICYLRPQIAKARRGGRRGKVTAVTTDGIVK